MFRGLTKFSVNPIVQAILTYVIGRQWHEAFLSKKVFVFTLTRPITSYKVSVILTEVMDSQLRDIPYTQQNLGNSNSEGIAENWIKLLELAEQTTEK